ncbi:hypothetical protein KP509_27G059300 [Ceratopteris richardii]|uniref:Pentatricopeptide repeat-containing protein n=1 Tax=Ceratopteris richardii TaxID=49495 RepID=A0A8T2RIJ0_CERRI|nr:hypothetical protein KP509_27G059300 [Ceratopteris richardii]
MMCRSHNPLSTHSWNSSRGRNQGFNPLKECLDHFHSLFRQQDSRKSFSIPPEMIYNATFVLALKACGCLGDIERGELIRTEMRSRGNLEEDLAIGTAFVDMYSKRGDLTKAQELFDKLPVRNVINWTALVAGYADHDYGREALKCLSQMQLEGLEGIKPDGVTYLCSLKACGKVGAIDLGHDFHMEIERRGLVDKDMMLGTALVDMKALDCLSKMQLDNIDPDNATFVLALKACGCLGDIERGELIRTEMRSRGNLEEDLAIGTAFVDMYSKCGDLTKAQELFDKLPVRNVINWTALVAGYADHDYGREALKCLSQMQLEGVNPNAITLLSCLKAYLSIGREEEANKVIDNIAEECSVQEDLFIGYVNHDYDEDALECYNIMQLEGIKPDGLGQSDKVFLSTNKMLRKGIKPNRVIFYAYWELAG